MSVLIVFCTSDIPSTIFERFLDAADAFADEYLDYDEEEETNPQDIVRIITSRDPVQCTAPNEQPFHPFESAFKGDSPEDIRSWFQANLSSFGESVFENAFIVLDYQTIKDSSTCFLVVCPSEIEPAQTMRCTFVAAFLDPSHADPEYTSRWAWDGEDDTYKGRFRRSKIVMTENNREPAMSGRFLSKVDGVWEMNEDTRTEMGGNDIRAHD